MIRDIIPRKKYAEDLTIQTIADELYMTPNYLSLLFKRNTGGTINEFITKTRIERGMELLRDPSVRVFEVSEMVGYSNSDYFTKVFKKYAGVKPSDYRGMFMK